MADKKEIPLRKEVVYSAFHSPSRVVLDLYLAHGSIKFQHGEYDDEPVKFEIKDVDFLYRAISEIKKTIEDAGLLNEKTK